MLAGNVKLKNFLMVAGVVGVAGIAGLYFACRGGDDGEKYSAPETRPDPRPVVQPTPQPVGTQPVAPQPVNTASSNLRDVDQALLKWQGKSLGGDKKKDAIKGRSYKVNLYQDAGHSVMNRAKIDLDRDDKWDEKWTFDGDNIARQVAPNDDEKYTLSFDWTGTDWKPAP
ncbi:MAG TPA: hypothetical protein VML75_19650 [Kofleriaceae bacterium]|nr:hypothetical protein [Kofleriaceae bacterium]